MFDTCLFGLGWEVSGWEVDAGFWGIESTEGVALWAEGSEIDALEACNGKVSASGTVSEVGFAVGSGAWAESMPVAEGCAGFFDASVDGFESPTKTFVRACDFASPAFFAASNPACRIAVVNGPSVVEDCGGRAEMVVDDGAFERVSAGWRDVEGVLGVDGVEIEGAGPAPTWSFSSPYSFHSSTSSRSYPFNFSAFVNNQYLKPPRGYTHADNHTHPHQARQFPLSRSSTPEHASLFVRGDIEGEEGDLVRFEDGFETRGGGDDV